MAVAEPVLEFLRFAFGLFRRLLLGGQFAVEFIALFLHAGQFFLQSFVLLGFFPAGRFRLLDRRFCRLQCPPNSVSKRSRSALACSASPWFSRSRFSSSALRRLGLFGRLLLRGQLAVKFIALLLHAGQFFLQSFVLLGFFPAGRFRLLDRRFGRLQLSANSVSKHPIPPWLAPFRHGSRAAGSRALRSAVWTLRPPAARWSACR